MPHFPKPFFKKGRGVWYIEIDRKQINLGPDRDEAFRRYHQLLAQPKPKEVPSDSVLAVIDAYLDWCQKHRAAHTYRWYRDRLQEFVRTIDPRLAVAQLRPFHVQKWIDAREGWSDGSRLVFTRTSMFLLILPHVLHDVRNRLEHLSWHLVVAVGRFIRLVCC